MFTTKLRIATATVAAAITVVGGAVPAAQAAKNTGRYQSSAEAKRQHKQMCQDLKTVMEGAQDAAKAAWEAGDAQAASDYDAAATSAYNDARAQKCGWAARRLPPTSHQLPDDAAPPPVGILTG